MSLKDYYAILQVEPSATLPEIKKAYRKLAQQYHPDKNQKDPYAGAQFEAIKEAYEVLTHPGKKERYLQQRWYQQSTGRKKTGTLITPDTVLQQALELERYVSRLDHFRMDKEGLKHYILDLLSDETVEQLNRFNDREANHSIIDLLLRCLKPLPHPMASSLAMQLRKIDTDPAMIEKINRVISRQKKMERNEQLRPLWIALLAALICVLIWILGRRS